MSLFGCFSSCFRTPRLPITPNPQPGTHAIPHQQPRPYSIQERDQHLQQFLSVLVSNPTPQDIDRYFTSRPGMENFLLKDILTNCHMEPALKILGITLLADRQITLTPEEARQHILEWQITAIRTPDSPYYPVEMRSEMLVRVCELVGLDRATVALLMPPPIHLAPIIRPPLPPPKNTTGYNVINEAASFGKVTCPISLQDIDPETAIKIISPTIRATKSHSVGVSGEVLYIEKTAEHLLSIAQNKLHFATLFMAQHPDGLANFLVAVTAEQETPNVRFQVEVFEMGKLIAIKVAGRDDVLTTISTRIMAWS